MANKEVQKTIAQSLKEYLDDNHMIVRHGSFSGKEFNEILSVLNETTDNFTIFNNSGGRVFTIWFYNDNWHSLKNFEEWIQKDKGYHYMYKINGKETFLQKL